VATNIVSQLLAQLGGGTLSTIASGLGESASNTQSALSAVLPALVGGLDQQASTTAGAASLLQLMRGNNMDSERYGDVASATTGTGLMSLIDVGRPLLGSVFGTRVDAIADWIGSYAGVSRSSSSSLMALALPLVLGQIAKLLKGTGGTAEALSGLLADQRGFLNAPAGLLDLVRGEEPAPAYAASRATIPAREVPPPVARDDSHRGTRAWLWAIPLLLLIPLIGYFMSRPEPSRQAVVKPPTTMRDITPGAVGTSSTPTRPETATLTAMRLPNGVALRMSRDGVESKLIGFLNDSSRPVSRESWFTFDRLEFESGTARLTRQSTEQLRNVAEILKAYPSVKIKIGGYTDNVGDDAHNRQLSQERADAMRQRIVGFGIDPSRVTAEGYGEAHPLADNSTEDGRQRNRRVDVRVTEK
jgi:outer membrane protein OmpA-like peptidoglycan-associated protein